MKDILNQEQRTYTTYQCHCLTCGRSHKVYGDELEAAEPPGADVCQAVNTKEIVAAGLECIDYSLMGKRARVAGRSTLNQIVWLHERRLRSEVETHVAVEEAPCWDTKEMELTYKDRNWRLQFSQICPSIFGWPVVRPRTWGVASQKHKSADDHHARLFCKLLQASWSCGRRLSILRISGTL